MNSLQQWLGRSLLFVFLLPLFFVLHAARIYFGAVGVATVLEFILLYGLLSAAFLGLGVLILRKRLSAGLSAWLLTALFLFWGNLVLWIKQSLQLGFLTRLPVLFSLLLGLVVLLAWLFRRSNDATQKRIVLLLNAAMMVYVLIEAALLTSQALNRKPAPAFTQNDFCRPYLKAGKHVDTPSLYLLVFDEYASSASLKEDWNFDNSATDSFLLSRNFSIQRCSRSNYPQTFFSIASLLNLSYLDSFPNNEVRIPDYHRCADWINHNQLMHVAKLRGYYTQNLSFFDMQAGGGFQATPFIASGAKLISNFTFRNRFWEDYYPQLAPDAAKEKQDEELLQNDRYNKQVAHALNNITPVRRPCLVYAHVLTPHDPYYFNADGSYAPLDSVRWAMVMNEPRYYRYQLRHANEVLRATIDLIMTKEAGRAVIVVLGDHGYRNKVCANPDAPFRNLSAVYYPDGEYTRLYDSATNVNLIRLVCNKVMGTQFPLLADRQVFIREKQ